MSTQKKLASLRGWSKVKIYAKGSLRLIPKGLLLALALNAGLALAYGSRALAGWGTVNFEAWVFLEWFVLTPSVFIVAISCMPSRISGRGRHEIFCALAALIALGACVLWMAKNPPRSLVADELIRLELLIGSPTAAETSIHASAPPKTEQLIFKMERSQAAAWMDGGPKVPKTLLHAFGTAWALSMALGVALSWTGVALALWTWNLSWSWSSIQSGTLTLRGALAKLPAQAAIWILWSAKRSLELLDRARETALARPSDPKSLRVAMAVKRAFSACSVKIKSTAIHIHESIVDGGLGDPVAVSALEREELEGETPETLAISKSAPRL